MAEPGLEWIVEDIEHAELPSGAKEEAIMMLRTHEKDVNNQVHNLAYIAPEIRKHAAKVTTAYFINNYLTEIFLRHKVPQEQGQEVSRAIYKTLTDRVAQQIERNLNRASLLFQDPNLN